STRSSSAACWCPAWCSTWDAACGGRGNGTSPGRRPRRSASAPGCDAGASPAARPPTRPVDNACRLCALRAGLASMDTTRGRCRRPGRRRQEHVPGYEMLTPVGFGAGGAVWRARDETGRTVVVSFLQLPPGDRGTALLRRLAALRSTCHPHLPRVLDVVGLGDDRCALVTDEVAGPTLTTVRTAGGALTPGAARTLLTALGSALAKLHTRGVIHGDVAPDNIVITAGGVPVLVDLAGEVSTERGTPGFAAPEVRTGAAAGAAADVWALAEVVR